MWVPPDTDQVGDAGFRDGDGGVSANHELAQSQGARRQQSHAVVSDRDAAYERYR